MLAHRRSDAFANRGAPLALNFRSILPVDSVAEQEINNTALSEQFVTIGAASLALLVVAAIAVLIGMA